MTGRAAHPLRRAAPLRLAASPGWLLLLTACTALLTASLVAPSLFARAAGGAALDTRMAAVEADAFANESPDLRGTWTGTLTPFGERVVRRELARLPSYGRPVVAAVGTAGKRGVDPVVLANGRKQLSTLYYRDGAVEKLGGDASSEGVWLAEDVAATLGVAVGDTVTLGIDRPPPGKVTRAQTVLAGTFARVPGSAMPVPLADDRRLARRDLPWDPDRPGLGSPVAITDRATFARLARAIAERPLFTADLLLDRDLTPAEAATATRRVQALAERAFEDGTSLAIATQDAKPVPTRLEVVSGLPDIEQDARATADVARNQAAPFAGAGVALSVLVVAAATVLLGRSRRREQDLLSGLGMRPREVAALTALELLLPAVTGALLGAGIAWLVVATMGPPGELTGGVLGAVLAAVGAVVLAVALGAACAGVAAWAADRRATASRLGSVRTRVPWEAVLLAATVVAGVAVVTTAVGDRPSSPLAVAFPLLLAAAVSLLVLRSLTRADDVLGRRLHRARDGSPRWLAGRRSRAGARETAAVTLALAVGLAVLGYALAVHRGVTQGVDDKVAALVGSRTLVDVGSALAAPRPPEPDPEDAPVEPPPVRTPKSPVPGGTVVYRQVASLPPAFGEGPLMALDTRTFAGAADWGASGTLDEAKALLPRLREESRTLNVILVGDSGRQVGDEGILNASDFWTAPYTVIGVLPAFPGSGGDTGAVTVVTDIRALMRYAPNEIDPRLLPAPNAPPGGRFDTWVWSPRSPTRVLDTLEAAGITPRRAEVRDRSASDSALLAAGWSSGYVVALGGCALLLVAAAALVLAVRLADRDAVSDVLLRRMAFSTDDLAAGRTWEIAGLVGSALVAAAVAVLALAVAPTTIEPLAGVAPTTRPRPGLPDAAVLVAACLVLVAAAAAVARRRAAARRPAEVLRGNG